MTDSKNELMEDKKVIADILNDKHPALSDEEKREAAEAKRKQDAFKAQQYQDKVKEFMSHDSMGYTKLPKK